MIHVSSSIWAASGRFGKANAMLTCTVKTTTRADEVRRTEGLGIWVVEFKRLTGGWRATSNR